MAAALEESVSSPGTQALRIVLFGAPGSGKSALLGALGQALGGASSSLSALQKGVYEGRLAETHEEVISYPVTLDGMHSVFIDCDGRAARRILDRQSGEAAKLAAEIRRADALLLTIDASASEAELDEEFTQFSEFLRLLEEQRGSRNEVAGLPVYLVLTKCDLLAHKGDTLDAWEVKIAERRQAVEEFFHAFLAERGGFGIVEFDVKVTAIRQPPLADKPAKSAAPFGVAELFRDSVRAAAEYARRNQQASSRLRVTVVSALSLLAVMLAAALVVFVLRPSPEVAALENSVRTLLPRSASTSERLKEPDKKLKQVEQILADTNFPNLPAKTKQEVEEYHQELVAYLKYNKDFLDQVRDPRLARAEAELHKIEEAMKRFALPEPYAADWSATLAGRRLKQYQTDIDTLRRAVADAEKDLQDLDQRRQALDAVTVKEYPQKRKELIADADKLPYFERNKTIAGSRISSDQVLHFERVLPWFRKWEAFRKGPLIGP